MTINGWSKSSTSQKHQLYHSQKFMLHNSMLEFKNCEFVLKITHFHLKTTFIWL